jgi:hypothetical protein
MKQPMTNSGLPENRILTPFLFRFAKVLPNVSYPPLRYDAPRQVSQTLVDGEWRDTLDASIMMVRDSSHTAVVHETTDDK